MPFTYHIVIVEDDNLLRKSLVNFYKKNNFNVSAFDCAEPVYHFIKHSAQHKFGEVDLIVSDIVLPGNTGLSLFQQLATFPELGKILMSIKGHDTDRITGLTAGADDYICKPVNSDELLLRTQSLLKRLKCKRATMFRKIHFLDYELDPESRELSVKGNQVFIGDLEHKLLLTLIGSQGKICTRLMLANALYSDIIDVNEFLSGRAMDALIVRLRKRFMHLNAKTNVILTSRNKGYMLRAEIEE